MLIMSFVSYKYNKWNTGILFKTKRVTSIDVNGTQIYDDKEIAKSVDRLVQVFGRCLPSARSFKFLMSGPSYTFRGSICRFHP